MTTSALQLESGAGTAIAHSPVLAKPAWWRMVCHRADLVPGSGIVAWWNGVQVALFYLPEEQRVYAVENRDPRSGANVIGRGLIGHVNGSLVIAAPLYKQHYRLEDGQCLEDPALRLQTWQARIHAWRVELA
jgi:nitrite reductase (NADH) small subunit